jgi:hypothetical protein
MVSVGQVVNIIRSDGRNHTAQVESINETTDEVLLKWFENAAGRASHQRQGDDDEPSGKEISIPSLMLMNPAISTTAYGLSIGELVQIRRSDGRTHSAQVIGIIESTIEVKVKWFEDPASGSSQATPREGYEAQGKEIDLNELVSMNVHLRPVVDAAMAVKGHNEVEAVENQELMEAVMSNSAETIKRMSVKGANMSSRNKFGETPLHWAVRDGSIDTVRVLLQGGARPNVHDKDGNTPLHWAAIHGHPDIIPLLVGAGGDVDQKNKLGFTPLGLARERGFDECGRQLMAASGNKKMIKQASKGAVVGAAGMPSVAEVQGAVAKPEQVLDPKAQKLKEKEKAAEEKRAAAAAKKAAKEGEKKAKEEAKAKAKAEKEAAKAAKAAEKAAAKAAK